MDFNKNKLLFIVGTAIVLILIFFLFIQTSTVNQSFSFSNFNMEKSILINRENRVENYTFHTENPIIAYLIVPKTIANDISLLTISGDYSTTIIESDPILLIKQNEYSPGIKKLTIETTAGNKDHTTILLPINLTDYENFTDSEKQELTETIKQFGNIDENYYTIEEVKKIIEEFAKGMENQIELKETKLGEKIIYFSEDEVQANISKKITATTDEIINNRTTQIINDITTENKSQIVIQLLQSITKKRTTNPQQDINQTSGWEVELTFSPEENYKLPSDINLFVSEPYPYDSLDFLFKDPNEDGTSKKPKITIEPNELSDYLTVEVSSEEEPFILSASVEFPETHINRYSSGTTITIRAIIDFYLEKRETININITFGECEQQLGDVLRQTGLTESQKQIILLGCYQEKIINNHTEIRQDFNELINLRNEIITRTSESIEGEINYQSCPEIIGEYTAGQIENYYACITKVPAKEFALTKTLELMTDQYLVDSLTDLDTCEINNNNIEKLLQTTITPIEKGTQPPIPTEVSEKSEINEKRLLALNQNKTIDKNIIDYLSLNCEINHKLIQTKKEIQQGELILGKTPANTENTYLDFYADFMTAVSEIYSIDEEIVRYHGGNKQMQINYKFDILTKGSLYYQQIVDEKIPFNPEYGWNLELDQGIEQDLKYYESELENKHNNLKNNYKKHSDFFECDTNNCKFYKKYFSLLETLVIQRKNLEENSNYWPAELEFVQTNYDLSNHLTTKEGIPSEIVSKNLTEAKKENAELLTNFLVAHFRGELEREIDLLKEVNKKTLEEIEENEPNWSVYFRPVKFGEMLAIGSGINQPENYLLARQNMFFEKVTTKQSTLSYLITAFNEDWNNWNNNDELTGNLNFFENMEKNYSNQAGFENAVKDRLFIKYKRLEKELRAFDENKDNFSNNLNNFMKVEQEQTLGIALGYQGEELLPIARINYQEIIDTEKDTNNIYLNKDVIAKAKTNYERIKPELTWIEAIGDWYKGEQETVKKELNKVTIDQRRGMDVLLNRIDLFTDIRYILAFEGAGLILKPVFVPMFATIGKSASAQFGKIAAWKVTQYSKNKIVPKLKPVLSFFNKTVYYTFYPVTKSAQTIRLTEAKLFSKLYNLSLKSRFSGFFTRSIEILASKPGYYREGFSLLDGGFFGTKKWLYARQNLIKDGSKLMLWDEESAIFGMQLIRDANPKGIGTAKIGNSNITIGSMKNESGQTLTVLTRARQVKNIFGKTKTRFESLTITDLTKTADVTSVSSALSKTESEAISALVYLSEQGPETKALAPTLKSLLPVTTDSTAIQTYTYNTAMAALKKGGIYSTRSGLVSTIICNSPCVNPAPIKKLAETISGNKEIVLSDDVTPNMPWSTIDYSLPDKINGKIWFVNNSGNPAELGAFNKGHNRIQINIEGHRVSEMSTKISTDQAIKVTLSHELTHQGFYVISPIERGTIFDSIELAIGNDEQLYAWLYRFNAWEKYNQNYFLRSNSFEEVLGKYKSQLDVAGVASDLGVNEQDQLLNEYIELVRKNNGKSYGVKLDDPTKQSLIDGAKERVGELRISKVGVKTATGKETYFINSDTLFDELLSVTAESKFFPGRVVEEDYIKILKNKLPEKAKQLIANAQATSEQAVEKAINSGKHPLLKKSVNSLDQISTTPQSPSLIPKFTLSNLKTILSPECVVGCTVEAKATGRIVQSTESGILAKATASRTEVDFARVSKLTFPSKPTILKEEILDTETLDFFCNSPCVLSDRYSHQVVKDSTLVEINYESMKGVSEVKPPETRVLPIDKDGMRSSINPNGLYKKVGDDVIPYTSSDIEALIEKAQNLKNKEGLVVSYYFNGVVQPVIYKLPVAKIIPADLPPMDYTLVPGFEETTKKTGVKIVKGIPTRAGQGHDHSLFHADEYGGIENFNLWIKKTLETPSYTYYRENGTKKIYVKPMDFEAKKISVSVTEITNGEEIYMTMYTVQIPDEYIKMLRNELSKGDHKTFKSKTDPDERVLIVGDKISIIVKRTNNGGKGINIQAKNSIIPLDNYEPVGANNVNRLFNDLDPTKIEINLSEIIN